MQDLNLLPLFHSPVMQLATPDESALDLPMSSRAISSSGLDPAGVRELVEAAVDILWTFDPTSEGLHVAVTRPTGEVADLGTQELYKQVSRLRAALAAVKVDKCE